MRNILAMLFFGILFSIVGCTDRNAVSDTVGVRAGGDFVLQSAAGPFDGNLQRGKVLLVYFGYTSCPDYCPTSFANSAQAINRLAPDEQAKVRLVMISVDPERDTPVLLAKYAAFFHHGMVGLTGSAEEVAAVARQFGVRYIKQPVRPDGTYAVDHDVRCFVVGPDGKLAATLKYGASVDEIAASIRQLL
jgi:protein SCO1/2